MIQPKTPPVKEVVQPKDVGVPRVDFTEEEKPAVTEEEVPKISDEQTVEETKVEVKAEEREMEVKAEPAVAQRRTKKEQAEDFCANLTDLANELEGVLDTKQPCMRLSRLHDICSELSRLATECEILQAQMTDRQSQAEGLVEAARAAADYDLQEELLEDYDNFDSMRFIIDIAQVRIMEEKLNAMRIDSMEDDAEETDEAWELRNIVAQLENRLEFSQDDGRMGGGLAEGFSQTDYASASQESEGGAPSYEVTEPSEGSVSSHEESGYYSTIPEKRSQEGKECEELRGIIDSLQRRIEILESERQDYRGGDTYENRELANLKEQLQNLSVERDNLVSQLNNSRIEAETLQQEKASLLIEADAIRQDMGHLQGEHLAALDYIKSLEESTAECTMLKEENKRFEDKLQQSNREQAKLHHEVHRLRCAIGDMEDDRKRTLNQLERLSHAAEWAKVLQKVH
ncbi:coiled-coil domain-containing protein 157-like [Schistocerca cancellata]|uniref:coiled-coil domain-containing protein 157-like n=1 Tax=Schistocerca cancellata TaxID=274614 RepID=UPI002117DDD4|nr:coiled-coil domain-containing protein 157-like [Schistocerca cancellata]